MANQLNYSFSFNDLSKTKVTSVLISDLEPNWKLFQNLLKMTTNIVKFSFFRKYFVKIPYKENTLYIFGVTDILYYWVIRYKQGL